MAVYPRKQTVFIFLASFFAVAGVFYYVNGGFFPQMESGGSRAQVSIETEPALTLNSDWQKQFTDSNLSKNSFKPEQNTVAPAEQLTLTAKLGREFLTKYAELKQSGLNQDAETVVSVMEQVVSDNLADLPMPRVYTAADVRAGAADKAALREYGNAILLALGSLPRENEIQIVMEAFQTEDMQLLARLDPVISKYKDLLAALGSIKVPPSLVQNHVNLMNGVSISLYNTESFRNMEADPIRGMAALSLEKIGLERMSAAVMSLHNYFVSAGIRIGS